MGSGNLFVFILASIAIHIAIVGLPISENKKNNPLPDKEVNYPVPVRLIPKSDKPVTLDNIKEDKDGRLPKMVAPSLCNDAPENLYTGIGIVYNQFTQIILDAPPVYPAYKAGVRIGDILLNPRSTPDKLGSVEVTVSRGDENYIFHIQQSKICYDTPKD